MGLRLTSTWTTALLHSRTIRCWFHVHLYPWGNSYPSWHAKAAFMGTSTSFQWSSSDAATRLHAVKIYSTIVHILNGFGSVENFAFVHGIIRLSLTVCRRSRSLWKSANRYPTSRFMVFTIFTVFDYRFSALVLGSQLQHQQCGMLYLISRDWTVHYQLLRNTWSCCCKCIFGPFLRLLKF